MGWVIFVDIRSSRLDKVVVKLFFLRGIGLLEAEQGKVNGALIAAAVSEPEANERGSSLIGKKSHYRDIESLFAKRKELWLCANETFTIDNALARKFGYA